MGEIGKRTISEIIDEYAEQMSHIRPGNVDGAKLVLERFAARLQAEWNFGVKTPNDIRSELA